MTRVRSALRRGTATVAASLFMAVPLLDAGAANDVLKPEQAYRYEVSAGDNSVSVHWHIQPGYYLYRQRIGFASRSPDVTLGSAQFPKGETHTDEYFGAQEIYRNEAVIRIPILKRSTKRFDLEIRSQGCADIGLCYPPQVWTASVQLPPAPAVAAAPDARPSLFGPRTRPGGTPLDPAAAFRTRVELRDPFNLRVSWSISPGYYVYRDSLKVATDSPEVQLGMLRLPPGTPKEDESFGKTDVFYGEVSGDLPMSRAGPAATTLKLKIFHQGCKEDSICYPPQVVVQEIALPTATAVASAAPAGGGTMVSEQDRLATLIGRGNLVWVMASFAGLGLLLAFTPCVLPMIPILSGIIVGQGSNVTTGRAFALSLTYVLGMALTYTAAGAGFAAAGNQIQAALQQPWIIVGVALLFVALALAMFGVYELQLPGALQTRLTAASNQQKAGTFIGTAVMGALSALVVTTCVAPPLVATLTVIAQSGDVARGALALFALSIGMGIPLLVIGTSAGRLLPKAGVWMASVKGLFGFLMLGLAIWMLDRILPGPVTMVLWAILVFMAGIFLGAFQSLDSAAPAVRKLGKGFGLLAALYGAVLLVGALSGARDPLRPLQSLGKTAAETGLKLQRIKSVAELDRELAKGKPVMLDFYADWCVSCKEMERNTFTSAEVGKSLSGASLLQADVTANDVADKELLARFGIFGPPTIVFFGADGRERTGYRVVGFMPPAEFAVHARRALAP